MAGFSHSASLSLHCRYPAYSHRCHAFAHSLLNLNMRRTQVKYNWNNLYHFYDFGHKVLSFSHLTRFVFVWNIICCLSKSCLVHFRLSALPSLRCCVIFDVIAARVCALHANNFMHSLSAFLLEFAATIRAIICFSILLTPIGTLHCSFLYL